MIGKWRWENNRLISNADRVCASVVYGYNGDYIAYVPKETAFFGEEKKASFVSEQGAREWVELQILGKTIEHFYANR